MNSSALLKASRPRKYLLGVQITRGDKLVMFYSSANRDEQAIERHVADVAATAGQLKHVPGPFQRDLGDLRRLDGRGGKMVDAVATVQRAFDRGAISHVAFDELHVEPAQRAQVARRPDQAPDFPSAQHEPTDQVGADVSIRAEHERLRDLRNAHVHALAQVLAAVVPRRG